MSEEPKQRVIAIVGRPNVGKSALFNRIVGRRVAIVHEESGVTRDRLSCETVWNEERFELIDTGGVGLMDGAQAQDIIEKGTRKQVDLAIQDASVVILVVDITAGSLPLDAEVAKLLHEWGRPVVIAANKADHEGLDDNAGEFESFGFPVFPIAAIHNRGIDDLMECALAKLPPAVEAETRQPLKVAIVGRPNVGKSSYINRILRNERVIVSEVAGTTRDSIEVPFTVGSGEQARHYVLIDTAGLRKATRAEAVEKFSVIRAENSIRHADVVVLVMDAAEGPKLQDKKIASRIDEARKGCLILINKWDLAQEEGVTQRAYGKALREALPFLSHVPIIFASAKSGYNVRKTIEAIDYVADQVRAHITTGLLNRVIQDAVQRVSPPVVRKKRLKIFYATQIDTQPPTVRIFVNDARRITSSYRSYLTRKLREAFGLEGAPLILNFKSRTPES